MSLTVVFREAALRNLARIRGEDKELFTRTRRAISTLADQPYPESAVAWGTTGVYRLHAGDIRILYEVDDQATTVYIINIGIIALICLSQVGGPLDDQTASLVPLSTFVMNGPTTTLFGRVDGPTTTYRSPQAGLSGLASHAPPSVLP